MISLLITDDDINKISVIISFLNEHFSCKVDIKQATNVQEAISYMQNNHFHLLITDLLMPIRNGEDATEKGGSILISEIYRNKNRVNIPLYIVALTHLKDESIAFSNIWKVWEYDSSSTSWRKNLKELFEHIEKIDSKIIKSKKETLFVEGETDKKIIIQALKLYYPEYINQISIETVKFGGGCTWVQRQLIIWGKMLHRKDDSKYLQAVGLFDNDKAGLQAINDLQSYVSNESAEHQTFSVVKLSVKHAKHLIPIYKNGICLPVRLEELYPVSCWDEAQKKGWLSSKKLFNEINKTPTNWDQDALSFKDYIKSLDIPNELMIYIDKKVNDDYKSHFNNYILSMDEMKQKEILLSFKELLSDILEKIGLK